MSDLLSAVDALTLPVKVRVTSALRPPVALSHPGMGGNDTDVVSSAHTGAQRKGEA